MPDRVIFWFRRDLRLADNPALDAAAAAGDVLGVFVADPALLAPAGMARRRYLARLLRDLDTRLDGRLTVVSGDPVDQIPQLAERVGAGRVYATADFGPYGMRRDEAVEGALATSGRTSAFIDSPYAVPPGTLSTGGGTPFQVFTPFHRAWSAHGWSPPSGAPEVSWLDPPAGSAWRSQPPEWLGLPDPPEAGPDGADGPDRAGPLGGDVGEAAALARLERFLAGPAPHYGDQRDRPGADATSRLSADLKWGTIHPRQILARLGSDPGHAAFARQLVWRDFYADVLFHRPDSARCSYHNRLAAMPVDDGPAADERFEAWAAGRTGFPIVDAGMRQLTASGWMHNRVRMITASFLVKDLHLDWTRGARWFLRHLIDGDLASNNHGWQWVAGTGTDAAPYFRIFNPVSQGEKFDPGGRYVRAWVPELAHVADKWVHQPWNDPSGPPPGYPPPLVDHARERQESLRRYNQATGRGTDG